MSFVVEADFVADVQRQLRLLLAEGGFRVSPETSVVRVRELYFSARRRVIEPRSRRVSVSRELSSRRLSPALRSALERIQAVSEMGRNLNPLLTTTLTDLESEDLLLNDWGIHHLHIAGTKRATRGFAPRSGHLLFAWIEPADAFFIDILDHRSFADSSLLEIVHTNWPHLLARYRLNGVSSVHPVWTSEERHRLRGKRLSVAFQARDGTVYAPPGGGCVASGLSVRVRLESDLVLTTARLLQEQCRSMSDRVAAYVRALAGRRLDHLALGLRLTELGLEVVETQTGVCVLEPWTPEQQLPAHLASAL